MSICFVLETRPSAAVSAVVYMIIILIFKFLQKKEVTRILKDLLPGHIPTSGSGQHEDGW